MDYREDVHWSCCPPERVSVAEYEERNAANHARLVAERMLRNAGFAEAAIQFVTNYEEKETR